MVRSFFWNRFGNGNGIHNVCWGTITKGKSKGGLGVRNLSIVKHSLMAKHIFKYLNNDAAICVDILLLIYGKINFWKDSSPAKCSWFFRGLYNSATHIKPYCRLNSVNPLTASILLDPWCFDVSLALRPTYANMNVDVDLLSLSDLVQGNHWNHDTLSLLFGSNLILDAVNFTSIDLVNHWFGILILVGII